MIELLKANWKPIASVLFVIAAWVFVKKFPLTPEQREDMQIIMLVSGIGAAALPGFRPARRADDEEPKP